MIRYLIIIFIIIFISISLGFITFYYSLTQFDGFNIIQVQQWKSFISEKNDMIDPYMRARIAQYELVPPDQAEGFAFYLWQDHEGKNLNTMCRYHLTGSVAESWFFTLYTVTKNLTRLDIEDPQSDLLPSALYSHELTRDKNFDLNIIISPHAESGNWLAITYQKNIPVKYKTPQDYGIVMTFYGTPIDNITGLTTLAMPVVKRIKGGDCG